MEPLPDHLRCKRTDGRQWRCNRRVMDDKKLCEIHHLQGKHRQNKRKVPESLKLQRNCTSNGGKKLNGEGDDGEGNLVIRVENNGKFVKKKKKKKKQKVGMSGGDMKIELMRMLLQREVEKQSRKKKKIEKSEVCNGNGDCIGISTSSNGDDDEGEEEEEEDLLRDLPYGLMAISPVKNNFSNVGTCDVKIGHGCNDSNGVFLRRYFRSKNVQPMPIGTTLQGMMKTAKVKKRRCHWCRRIGLKNLIRCSSCQKRFFCEDCIKEQNFDMQDEVKIACPVCRGTCTCKLCSTIQCRDIECKGSSKDKSNVNKVLHFHYLICTLLPVLKKINQDQSIEVEIESNIRGQEPSDFQVQQAEVGCSKPYRCNNCKTSIVDFHRSCPRCSYNLCLSCCRDIFQGNLLVGNNGVLCKCSNRKKNGRYGKQLSERKSMCTCKQNNGSAYYDCSVPLLSLKVPDINGGISCPPKELGGCGDSLLDLCCVFPTKWIKDLEINAEEIIGCYELPETVDIFSCCSLCDGMDCEDNGTSQSQKAATREGSNDNFLYYPSVMDVHSNNLEHFQKHWGKGQPVIVRKVLKSTSDLSWDPIVMFCTYLKNNVAKSENKQVPNCLDWFEIEIGVKQMFMGSFTGPRHANMWHERLKLKGWLSSHLFQEHFPAHFGEILRALPLPEYMDPGSGLLNIAAELPQEVKKPDLGPCVYISYGSGDDLLQADSVTKLRYDSYDVVNILAHTADIPISTEQLNYIRKLMKKHEEQINGNEMLPLDARNIEVVELHDMITEEMSLHKKVARVSWFSAASREATASRIRNRDLLFNGESDRDSDSDTDTDTEVSKFYVGPVRNSENHKSYAKRTESSNQYGKRKPAESCGALWDVFRRQDVSKLKDYLKMHSDEFPQTYGFQKQEGRHILDQNFFLDATHKMRLKEEFKIEPWTFEQHVGEAVIIPAGCPYQIRNLKSCVNVVLDFVSPENVTECIRLVDELRLLPENHKAKVDSLEVKKMALYSISRAVKEIRELTCPETSGEHIDRP